MNPIVTDQTYAKIHLIDRRRRTVLAAGCSKSSDSAPTGNASSGGGKKLTIALMPKSKGNAYFISCKQGADEAAKELGVELIV